MQQEKNFVSLIKFGSYLAGVLILCSVLKHGIWSNANDTFLLLCNLLLAFPAYLFFISKGIKYAKNHIYQDNFKNAKGVKAGMFIGLVAAVIFSAYVWCETQIFPDYYSQQLQQQELMIPQNLSSEETAAKLDELNSMNQPYVHVSSAFFTVMMASVVVSMFATPFIHKKLIVKSEEKQE
ncbi:MAG: DUF4199 domain-containing protein [Bacteroidales bacterium]|nr:DUF4199 domain-containing protein [Bacteroidales bacterium]